MEYARLGTTGLKVSRICLGCMSYGAHRALFEGFDGEKVELVTREAIASFESVRRRR